MATDVESILRVCGIGKYLHIGCGQSSLVVELLQRSMDAYGLDASTEIVEKNLENAPWHFFKGSIAEYPFKTESFDTVIIGEELFHYAIHDFNVVFKTLRSMTKNNLVLYFPPEVSLAIAPQRPESKRIFWQRLAIDAGFRLHPRSMLVVPYNELENEDVGKFIFFERISDVALDKFPMSWLLANRDLHMDMLREAGRRSDGHVSRYVLAAMKVRPGDTVLDAACGLGYGTAVLAACSPGAKFIGVDIDPDSIAYAEANFAADDSTLSYQACDVTNLSFLPDHSIDTVISFETIEHVPDYEIFLKEVKRVLKPDGRFLGSVPNLWCDETGNDPNPYHFHVFDWNKLNEAVSQHFIVDGRWAQNAGGGFKLWNSKRSMWNVPLDQVDAIETEWWVFSACADPRNHKDLPYTNPFYKDINITAPQHVHFEKYYDNPWIYRVMVQLGERLSERNVLIKFCSNIAGKSRLGSADQGASLCVLAHQFLEMGGLTIHAVTKLIQGINAFDAVYDRENIHSHRWAISLHYIAGRLLLAVGNRDAALSTFLTCAEMDPMRFSPLLATKTISSRMYAGLILTGNNQLTEAQEQFNLGMKEAHRVLQGDWSDIIGSFENPLLFGLQEAAEVLDVASQCAQAFHALKRQESIPGYLWEKVNLKRFGLVEWNKYLEREISRLHRLIANIHVQEATPVA